MPAWVGHFLVTNSVTFLPGALFTLAASGGGEGGVDVAVVDGGVVVGCESGSASRRARQSRRKHRLPAH
jgi:hypothetical protein